MQTMLVVQNSAFIPRFPLPWCAYTKVGESCAVCKFETRV